MNMNSSIMATYKRLPIAFTSGAGAWLCDQAGNRYFDALSGISVCSIGHANPVLAEALCDQASKLIHTSNLYEIPLQEQLARRLCGLSGLDQVFFANSGAEANEAAIKLCRKYAHNKGVHDPVIVVMDGSFHGRTLATLTATGNDKIKAGFGPFVPGFHAVPYNNVAAIRALAGSDMAIVAVMLEPIQGEGGIRIPNPTFLQEVKDLCEEQGWLLVLDEIQTGMCRTGKWFAWQHSSVRPDIMTLAKALGNGIPIGACLANNRVAEAMGAGSHGSTFGGSPFASRASITVIDYMTEHALGERARTLGAKMLQQFTETLAPLAGIREVRGKGLMFGIELTRDCGELVEMALRDRLLLNVTADNVVRLLPPLIISDAEAEHMINQVCSLIRKFLAG
ncbi:MAG: argD [Gammaproteobacteria bacterium]|nr:argD [Gammaproteobacteria bacterium]